MAKEPLAKDKKTDYFWVDSRKLIEEEGYNERENWGDLPGLAKSILAQGVQQPLIVNKKGEYYSVKSGNRRRRACKILEEQGHVILVPVILERRGISPERRVLHQVIDNGGLGFSPWEQAKVMRRMRNFGWSEKDTAAEWGVSTVYVRRLLSLADAPQKLINLVRERRITGTFAMDIIAEGRVEEVLIKAEQNRLPANNAEQDMFSKEYEPDPPKPQRITRGDLQRPASFKKVNKWAAAIDENGLPPAKKEAYTLWRKWLDGALTEDDFKNFFQ